ncbi:MAG: hypothetical protein ACI88A_003706 [Paraglaciecola sp.]|jgi:uncharacterized protein YecA (UPF0149 family)
MSNSRTARTQIKKMAQASVNKPSFYYVHGFFVGLAVSPEMLPFSKWLNVLFVDLHFPESEEMPDMNGLMWQYNQVMDECIDSTIKLPAQCKLSPTNFKASLQADEPLPQWCSGFITALDLIDERALSEEQKDALLLGRTVFSDFTDYAQLKRRLSMFGESWQATALEMRRNLAAHLVDMLAMLRFGFEDDEDSDWLSPDEVPDSAMEEFEEMLDFALYDDSKEAEQLVESLIESYEATVGAAFFEENRGHFWLMDDTRPYMMLRYRRARTKFTHGHLDSAIREFQDLIGLNPNDNQNVRSVLANLLIVAADWPTLAQLLEEYCEDESLPLEASRALMLYAQKGDSEAARVAKQRMKNANKHAVKYLTGQAKSKGLPEHYTPGQASEAEVYQHDFAKEAWRSVAGALFWLRRK